MSNIEQKIIRQPLKTDAFVIANTGLGDSISIIGLVNYLSTIYKRIFVTCIIEFYEHVKTFYDNPKIIVYPINKDGPMEPYEFTTLMQELHHIYDLYPIGNYGAIRIDMKKYIKTMKDGSIRKIISKYPTSYYSDANVPIECLTKYFSIKYPQDILDMYDELLSQYPIYRVVHQNGSNAEIDVRNFHKFDINTILTIDVNKNLYKKGHAFYDISQKFINLRSVIYYGKLLENASELYLIDSCIHALALVVDISKATTRICYKREARFNYGIPNKFQYCQLIFRVPDIMLEKHGVEGMHKNITKNSTAYKENITIDPYYNVAD